jgi:hypothetical protein
VDEMQTPLLYVNERKEMREKKGERKEIKEEEKNRRGCALSQKKRKSNPKRGARQIEQRCVCQLQVR